MADISRARLLAHITEEATAVRRQVLALYRNPASCIETAWLLERRLSAKGVAARRIVTQAIYFSPAMVAYLNRGGDRSAIASLPDDHWSVALGHPEREGDFVGRMDAPNNRFVGHVIVFVETFSEAILIDPSADQAARPDRHIDIGSPIVAPIPLSAVAGGDVHLRCGDAGPAAHFRLYPDTPVPDPSSEAAIELLSQMAKPRT